MPAEFLRANCLEFSDRAGELQRAGASASLIRELGDNYGRYHAYLALRLQELGGQADPADFPDDPAAYGRHANELQRIATSEALLRRARAHRREGHPLDEDLNGGLPLVDSERRLVDVEHPERATFRGPLARMPSAPPQRYPTT